MTHRARDAASGVILAERLRAADTHWSRLKGLLGTRSLEAGDGLWLKSCRQVHMIGMRYAVDLMRDAYYGGLPSSQQVQLFDATTNLAIIGGLFVAFMVVGTFLFVRAERNR